jgi:hypothetical protein
MYYTVMCIKRLNKLKSEEPVSVLDVSGVCSKQVDL